MKNNIRGKDLIKLGFPQGPVISVAMNIASKSYKHSSDEEILGIFKNVLDNPSAYIDDEILKPITEWLIEKRKTNNEFSLNENKLEYPIFGNDIEQGALDQMDIAMRLPVSRIGAIMSDSHQGFGLPIGGVLATENVVSPWCIGNDISCCMTLSIFDIPSGDLSARHDFYKRELIANTLFGTGKEFDKIYEHPVLDRIEFSQTQLLRSLKDKAAKQLGTSGSSNHFCDIGIIKVDDSLGIPVGEYVAVLTHSGSRGLGAKIADHYTKIAKQKTLLPKEAENLAWLDLNSEEGMEYWIAMHLAGDYAYACHDTIHEKISKNIKSKPIAKIQNRHNFAWKQIVDGKELIVHRKGATPAGLGVLGIIPGSMATPGFIVRGKGSKVSLESASHGAGRKMSRTAAKNSITKSDMKNFLDDNGVTLIGGDLDESPQAYKDIYEVMKAQTDLVDIVGTFYPKIVRMNNEEKRSWRDKKHPVENGE